MQGGIKKAKAVKKAPTQRVAKRGVKVVIPPKRAVAVKEHAMNKKLTTSINRVIEEQTAKKALGSGKLTVLKAVAEAANLKDARDKKKKN